MSEETQYKYLVKLAAITGIISRTTDDKQIIEANSWAWDKAIESGVNPNTFYVDVKLEEKKQELL